MTRRCSVMCMPLDVQSASMLAFGSVTRSSYADHKTQGEGRLSHQVAAQHQRGRGFVAVLPVIAGPPADLAEARALVKPPRRRVVLFNLEEHGASAKTREPPQMQLEQAAGDAAAAPRRCDRDREDFRFVAGQPRQDEAGKAASHGGAMGDDVAVEQQPLELAVAPAVTERRGMK